MKVILVTAHTYTVAPVMRECWVGGAVPKVGAPYWQTSLNQMVGQWDIAEQCPSYMLVAWMVSLQSLLPAHFNMLMRSVHVDSICHFRNGN